jgi:hypothetical protein
LLYGFALIWARLDFDLRAEFEFKVVARGVFEIHLPAGEIGQDPSISAGWGAPPLNALVPSERGRKLN